MLFITHQLYVYKLTNDFTTMMDMNVDNHQDILGMN